MTKEDGMISVAVEITGMGSVTGDLKLSDLDAGRTAPVFADIKDPVTTKPLPAKPGGKTPTPK